MTDSPEYTATALSDDKADYWLTLHAELQDMLAGYADNELTAEQVMCIEAHLSGCAECRNDLARQQVLTANIAGGALIKMPLSTQQSITQKLSQTADFTSTDNKPSHVLSYLFNRLKSLVVSTKYNGNFVTNSGWVVAASLLIIMLSPWYLKPVTSNATDAKIANIESAANMSDIPMIDDVLAQYQHIQQNSLPAMKANATRTVNWQDADVLASWTVDIGGAPAQAFAIRYNNQVILQVEISPEVFFRNAEVRQAVAKTGLYRSQQNKIAVLAMPTKTAGIIIVGPENSLPEHDNIIES